MYIVVLHSGKATRVAPVYFHFVSSAQNWLQLQPGREGQEAIIQCLRLADGGGDSPTETPLTALSLTFIGGRWVEDDIPF